MSDKFNAVGFACSRIAAYQAAGATLEDAAWMFSRRWKGTFSEVLEIVGSWPSDEPDIRALQRVAEKG